MNFNIEDRTILLVKHGSHAYGLATPTSDVDIKGVCMEPAEACLGFLNVFEQHEAMVSKGHPEDKVIFSLRKFMRLAADCNPNIIEVLHVDSSDILKIDAFGEILREHKDAFLSKKAKFTFSGYAHAQLKRIKSHRSWLLDKPSEPKRSDFGLLESTRVSRSELGAFDSLLGLKTVDDEAQTVERAEEIAQAAVVSLGVELPKDIITLFTREKAYQAAVTHYNQYLNWLKTRNPARAELEAKYGYDTKHGSHLLRLMRMCAEILEGKGVIVKRPDREQLLDVKYGRVPYDVLIDEAEKLEARCEELYLTSTLPREPNRNLLDALCVDMMSKYIRDFG